MDSIKFFNLKILSHSGALYALIAAGLFGISPTLTKMVIGDWSPILIAGILYLGSGIGLLVIIKYQKIDAKSEFQKLSNIHRWKLLGAIISGGILAPICLSYGIQLASAFEVSLLLNLESVTTTLIAALVFKEYIGRRVWIGKALIIAGALALSVHPGGRFLFSQASLLVVAACIFWGIDNNLTRDVDALSPSLLACTKGLTAGAFNTALAISLGATLLTPKLLLATLTIGAFCYGLSLVLFILALRLVGSSRTSTYFASGPFFGALFAVVVLGDVPTWISWWAMGLMGLGVILLLREDHTHEHTHEELEHTHSHIHDEHHEHNHLGSEEGAEFHSHPHVHSALKHSHQHTPDIHHRHSHSPF
jgi:drug/metabolite transporter (DMT)-like permease